jgi:hypothetical protein
MKREFGNISKLPNSENYLYPKIKRKSPFKLTLARETALTNPVKSRA